MKAAEVSNQTGIVDQQGTTVLPRRFNIAILALFFVIFIIISVLAHIYPRFPGDLFMALHIQTVNSGFVNRAMEVISEIGGGQVAIAILLASALLLWVKNKRQEGFLLVGAGILSLSDRLVKMIVNRPRPSPDMVSIFEINGSRSFPSGHATLVMVLFGSLFYLSSIYIRNKLLKRSAQIISVLIILLTGISRVYLGAHWPSDVLGGYLLGSIIVVLLIVLHKKMSRVAD